jgi:hypothetical protein
MAPPGADDGVNSGRSASRPRRPTATTAPRDYGMRTSPQGSASFRARSRRPTKSPWDRQRPQCLGATYHRGAVRPDDPGPPLGEKDATHDEAENSRWMTTTWSGPWGNFLEPLGQDTLASSDHLVVCTAEALHQEPADEQDQQDWPAGASSSSNGLIQR